MDPKVSSSGSNEGLGHILEGTFHLACEKHKKNWIFHRDFDGNSWDDMVVFVDG
jgi:hypothetical protein